MSNQELNEYILNIDVQTLDMPDFDGDIIQIEE